MYQSIDETDDVGTDGQITRRNRFLMTCLILVGLACLIGIAYTSSLNSAQNNGPRDGAHQERVNYLEAITTPLPAMRRARLTDFLSVYPDSERQQAVNAQLAVLNREEGEAWAALTHIIFDTGKNKEERLVALATYEKDWNPLLLGGRESEAARIRESLELEPLEPPNRKMKETTPDPESVPNETILVGGAPEPVRTYTYIPPVTIEEPAVDTGPVITPSRILRERKPRYPRRALDKGVEGLVVLKLYIDDNGRVEGTELVFADAERYEKEFIRSAKRAARGARFHPKKIDGKPTAEIREKRYKFAITN